MNEGEELARGGAGTKRAGAAVTEPPMVVDPRWIVRALAVLLGVALLCGYATFCLLFYQGQWQMVFHPVRTTARPETLAGRTVEEVHFGPDATGVPQRVGWWIPAAATGDFRHLTVLYLPDGDGSLASETKTLEALAGTGVAIFAVDWRGFGASAPLRRPSEESLRADAEAALGWLTGTHGTSEARVIPYGRGLGAAVALWMTGRHEQLPAMVLDGPRFDVEKKVAEDPRVRLLPVRWLFRDKFPLEPMLGASRRPKLIVLHTADLGARVDEAGDPKMTVNLPEADVPAYQAMVQRFLGAYAPPTPEPLLLPSAAGAAAGKGKR